MYTLIGQLNSQHGMCEEHIKDLPKRVEQGQCDNKNYDHATPKKSCDSILKIPESGIDEGFPLC